MKISIMNLTNRHGGIDILWANMKRQTEQDFELVIVDGLWKEREQEVKDYINDPRLVYVRQNDKPEGAYTGLAHADNQGFKTCSGELIVCLQDYIWIGPQALEKYWFHHQEHPEGILVTGVGDQFSQPYPINPQGKVSVYDQPYTRRPERLSWVDPRRSENPQTTWSECPPVSWEMNWCSIPRKVIYELGGMDEEFDNRGFAWDNTYIASKAKMAGYKIYLDKSNECMGFNHDEWWPNPLKVNRISPRDYFFKKLGQIERKEIPLKDPYLE